MQTTLTDEQRLLRDTVNDLAGDLRASPETIAEQTERAASWQTIGELGLPTMRWAEAAGGVEASAVDVTLVAEALAHAPAVVPFVGPVLAAELLMCSDASAETMIGAAELGLHTVLLDSTTLDLPATEAVAWDAAGATGTVGLVHDGDAATVILGDLADGTLPSADLTRVVRRVASAGHDDGGHTVSPDALDAWYAFALTVISADLVGTMAGALDLGVGYARDRRQFGRPIGAFQALAHMLADACVGVEAARSATTHAAWAVDHAAPAEALMSARVAKAYAARVALSVAELTTQVHGGIGTTWESPCHLFVRRALTGSAILGDEHRQLEQIATARLGAR